MTAERAVQAAAAWFDSGEFRQVLARRIAYPTESQRGDSQHHLSAYLQQEIKPALAAMGFELHDIVNPQAPGHPFLIACRTEDPALPTLLSYGHGDVVSGDESHWRPGLSPWQLVEEGDRWYGRGSADNKGQHSVNLAALEQVFRARGGRLGFNCKLIFESGEEISSPGLADLCREQASLLQADLFIAADGPRLNAVQPTLFLGSRGCANFRLTLHARDKDYHSGNWGGLLSNPASQLANALACLVDPRGALCVAGLRPPAIDSTLRAILARIPVESSDPTLDEEWGEPGLTAAERLYGWNTLEVLSMLAGNPARPMNAIPGEATAVCQLRFVVGTDWTQLEQHVRDHLAARGFGQVKVELLRASPATRLDPTSPLVDWALEIMQQQSGKTPALLPNLGGSLPNEVFSGILGLPTLWIPHSYPACGQHAADEHMLKSIAREGLLIMTRLLWQLGEPQAAALLTAQREHAASLAAGIGR